jgi:2-polyprenyl-3-methyl-5-hydroxy-6-metoxy-1,4-benzoquinol methylase
VAYKGDEFADFDLRPFLDEMLLQLPIRSDGSRAFEYGTGTGPGACYLAERGFRVDAIDTSSVTIEMARRFTAERGLEVTYEVGDIANLRPWKRTYNLVVDNFCLHN